MANEVSLYGAVKINGFYVPNNQDSYLMDIAASDIAWVMNATFPQGDGNDTAGFWLKVVMPQQETAMDVFLHVTATLTNLTDFNTALVALSATNKFTLYEDLVKGSDISANLVPTGTNMLINDIYTDHRFYLVDQDQTRVDVDVKNRHLLTQWFFDGDQTTAGNYTYFGA